jgi:AAA domain, putative AbiEii toxin, Type IV TA system
VYVTNISIQNLGPISSVSIAIRPGQAPKPIILVGANGAGKTVVLSLIADAMIEAKKLLGRSGFDEFDDITDDFRVAKGKYIKSGHDFSLSHIRFEADGVGLSHLELATHPRPDEFRKAYPDFQIEGHELVFSEQFRSPGAYCKQLRASRTLDVHLRKTVLLYFPPFRRERPAWLDKEVRGDLNTDQSMYGLWRNFIVQVNVIDQVLAWLCDLQLTRLSISYAEAILAEIYRARDPLVDTVQLIIPPGQQSSYEPEVKATILRRGEQDNSVRGLEQLSSGEMVVFSIFCAILRSAHYLFSSQNVKPSEISGVVLIDEIDLHLHIVLQREVLPKLIAMFPKVQLIIATHSPLFLLGMAAVDDEAVEIFDLSSNAAPISANDFSEFRVAYDAFLQRDHQFKFALDRLKGEVAAASRPLVVTEGKTDWKHLKAALSKLRVQGKFTLLDVQFLEYGSEIDMGDAKLMRMCEWFAHIPNQRKLIFMFDRDNSEVVSKMGGGGRANYKVWGNSVFSFCIPVPSHREDYKNISIESYYTDAAIHTIDPSTGRRLFYTNEIELVQRPDRKSDRGRDTVRVLSCPEAREELTKKIFDEGCEAIRDEKGLQLAHSKSVFADSVLNARPGFDGIDMTEFSRILHVIQEIDEL